MHSNIIRLAAWLTLTLLLFAAGCHDAPEGPQGPQLPPETQTGAGTLGFKIGDKVYISRPRQFVTEFEPGGFDISGGGPTEERWTIGILADSITDEGIYRLDTLLIPGNISPSSGGAFQDLNRRCFFFTAGTIDVGTLEVTKLDRANRILSGRFSFQADSPFCGKVQLTDGRFDVKF